MLAVEIVAQLLEFTGATALIIPLGTYTRTSSIFAP